MPVVINEIVITTNIEKGGTGGSAAGDASSLSVDVIVKETVERVMEILDEKKER